jgi:hypothetical protein
MGQIGAALCDEQGQLVERWDELPKVPEAVTQLALAYSQERQAELEGWLPKGPRLWTCSWPDAALAGAFSGQPGLLLSTENWSWYNGCAAKNGPETICQSLVCIREANHRTLAMAHGEGGLEWLTLRCLELPSQVKDLSRHRLQQAFAELPRQAKGLDEMRARSRAALQALLELADYPGPDPACLALLAQSGRRLCDLLRRAASRVRLPQRAAWLEQPLSGPWWEALQVEVERYLPQLSWQAPEHPPEVGACLLVVGALLEEQRRALNPAGAGPALEGLTADAWRQLQRR